MSTATRADQRHRTAWRRVDAVLGGPVWWAVHLGAVYWFIPRACRIGITWPIHLLTLVLLVLCARAGLSGLQLLRAGGAAGEDRAARRDVFLGWTGLSLATFFGAVIVAEWVPVLYLDPCW